MPKVVKQAGQSAASQRHGTTHGTASERRLLAINGRMNRANEKPGNTYTRGNDNQRSRGPSRPGR